MKRFGIEFSTERAASALPEARTIGSIPPSFFGRPPTVQAYAILNSISEYANALPLARSLALAHRAFWWTISRILYQPDIPQARAAAIVWPSMAARTLSARPRACQRTQAVRCGRARA